VVFCDLRGFTRFAGSTEPEDVAEVLGAYYGVLGEQVRAFAATVGTFAGDGIMAYFNDPVPCPDPPGRALDLACALRPPLDALVERWRRQGWDLGYGVGVAYGYATLGTIGFEGRYDYTAVGTVVNLAARLCGEAAAGEVLVDERTFDAVRERVSAERLALDVKGYDLPVTAYRVRV
jgi:class 3 adenylate cyclase